MHLVPHVIVHLGRDANSLRLSKRGDPRRHVHTVPEQVALAVDDIPDMDSDPDPDPALGGLRGVPRVEGLLDRDRAPRGLERAWELDEEPVAHRLDHPSAVGGEQGSQEGIVFLEELEREVLVRLPKEGVPDDVGDQDRAQPAFLFRHGRSPLPDIRIIPSPPGFPWRSEGGGATIRRPFPIWGGKGAVVANDPQMLLAVRDLKKSYGTVHAVDGVSFAVRVGTVFTLLGPNGAGKTTTLEILEGIRDADEGEIEMFGARVRRVTAGMKGRMGVLLQEGGFEPYLRVREVLALFASFFDRPRPVAEVLAEIALEDKAGSLVRHLSGGQKQRLALGAALINDPDLVFLDEPTTGLDPQARHNIWAIVERLKGEGKTIVLTTHYMEEAEALSDEVCIMDHGRVIAHGSPRDLTSSLGQETLIEFDAFDLSPEALASLPGEAHGDGTTVTLTTPDLVAALEGLLSWSRERGIPLRNMVVRQPNLEDVFLSLTGRRLRA